MKKIVKKWGTFLVVLSIALAIFAIPMTTFAADDGPECEGGQTIDEIAESGSSGDPQDTLVSEITEPLGDFDQVIESGGINVSEVYWKAQCLDAEGAKTNIYFPYSGGTPTICSETICGVVQIIKGTSGTGILKTYIALIYRWAAGIVGIIAVLVIVISGIQISMDQGSGENVTAAKNRIMQSLAGLVVLFLSALILYTINPTFFT